MNRMWMLAGALAVAGNLLAATEVVVDLEAEVGPVKIMNAVNNGPSKPSAYVPFATANLSNAAGPGESRSH